MCSMEMHQTSLDPSQACRVWNEMHLRTTQDLNRIQMLKAQTMGTPSETKWTDQLQNAVVLSTINRFGSKLDCERSASSVIRISIDFVM